MRHSIHMHAQRLCQIALLLAAVIGTAICALSTSDSLPASFVCSVEVLDVGNHHRDDASETEHKSDRPVEHLLRISLDTGGGGHKGQLYYYLREIFNRGRPVKKIHSTNKETGKYDREHSGSGRCSYEHYTSWLMPLRQRNESRLRDHTPGVVSLCNGIANGTLPINGTHTSTVESLNSSAAVDSLRLWHRVSVHRTRSLLGRWRQLDNLHRTAYDDQQQITFETGTWPTQRPLHRVRRSGDKRYAKSSPDSWLKSRKANVAFNLQTRFLTKYGPYVIRLHVYLTKEMNDVIGGDNKAAMMDAAKQVVSYANTLLRPFNTYILVSSMQIALGPSDLHTKFNNEKTLMIHVFEYVQTTYRIMVDEVTNGVFVFLGRKRTTEPISESASDGEICKTRGFPSCRGYVILESGKPDDVRIAGFALAHELGQRFGCANEEVKSKSCECQFPKCVMEKEMENIEEAATIGWSKCSIKTLAEYLDQPTGRECLKPVPADGETFVTDDSVDWGPTCGNGIVETGEECDCGGVHGCRLNHCCQPGKCILAKDAKCAVGNCCDLKTCAPSVSGSLCRPASDAGCDFPELCDGQSTVCPPDVAVTPDWPCDAGGKLRCRSGRCLPAQKKINYTGPSCSEGSVPVDGACRPKHVPQILVEEVVEEEGEESGEWGNIDTGYRGGSDGGRERDNDLGVGLRASAALALSLSLLLVLWPIPTCVT